MLITRAELNKKYNISRNMWNRRHDDLIEFLQEYMDITEVIKDSGHYFYEVNDMPESIPQLPRKSVKQKKIDDYTDYVSAALGTEWKPNSKTKVARDAIENFAFERYGHTSPESIVKRYIGNIMDDKGEHSEKMVWVHYNDYTVLNDEELGYLRDCFRNSELSDDQMRDAFIKYADGQSIEKEVNRFNCAMEKFKEKYGYRPIHVYHWRAKVIKKES